MDNKVTGRAAVLAKDGAAFGGGGAEIPGGVCAEGASAPGCGTVEPDGDVDEGPGAGLELGLGPVLEGGLAGVDAGGVAVVPVTLIANFWPSEQC